MSNYDQTTSDWQTIPGHHVTCAYFSRNVLFVSSAVAAGCELRPDRRCARPDQDVQAGYVSWYGPGTRAGARLPPRRVAGAYHGIHGVYRADPSRVPYDERREPGHARPGHGLGQREPRSFPPGNAPGDDQVPDHAD